MARWDKAVQLLRLARMLAASSEGLPMARLTEELGTGRRTVERMMGAVEEVFGSVDRLSGDGASYLYRLPIGGGERFLSAVRPPELAELGHAIEAAERTGLPERAEHLRELERKLRATMRLPERTRVDVDLEAIMEAEALARRPEPHAPVPAAVLQTLRTALLAGNAVSFGYADRAEPFQVVPYGILFGLRSYLVCAFEGHDGDPFLYRLDRMRDVTVLNRHAPRPNGFDFKAFAARSFGTFQETPQEVRLRFLPDAVPDAETFRFHPTQASERLADGSLRVTFTAGGLRQVAHHLFTWGDTVRIEAPDALREEMRAALAKAGAALD